MNSVSAASAPRIVPATRPIQFSAKLQDKIEFGSRYVQYFFEMVTPPSLSFLPGQYVSIQVSPEGHRRSYSLAQAPEVTHGFQLLLNTSPGGVGSQFFTKLKLGDEIQGLGPMGRFFYMDDVNSSSEELIFIATGSGVAPLRSMILHALQAQRETRPITLLWGLRHLEDLHLQDEFQELADLFPNFKFHPVLSKPGSEWPLCRGRVTDCLRVHAFPANSSFYLCGSEVMIAEVSQYLLDQGADKGRIYYEKFF